MSCFDCEQLQHISACRFKVMVPSIILIKRGWLSD